MVATLASAILFLTFQRAPTPSAVPRFPKPSEAYAYANAPVAEWKAALKAHQVPKTRIRPDQERNRRANKLCPLYGLESTSGEELYWLAELCQYQKATQAKALSAAERYLATENPAHAPQARLLLAILQTRVHGTWEASWDTMRSILQQDPIGSDQETQIRVAIEVEADTNEATALEWSEERYRLLRERATNPKPGAAAVSYQWVVMAGGDLVHRYYLSGDAIHAEKLVADLKGLADAHANEMPDGALHLLNSTIMEMKDAPSIPVLNAIGKSIGPDLVQKGRIEVVSFFFLRCPPCIYDLGPLDELQKKYSKNNVLVTAVTTYKAALQPDTPPTAKVDSALTHLRRKKAPGLTMVVAPEHVLQDYNIIGFPVIAVIDKKTRLRYLGDATDLEPGEAIDRLVDWLLNEGSSQYHQPEPGRRSHFLHFAAGLVCLPQSKARKRSPSTILVRTPSSICGIGG
jgi:thiol-disulfide isomerase/thioredoxin